MFQLWKAEPKWSHSRALPISSACGAWAQIFTTRGSHQYCVPAHWISFCFFFNSGCHIPSLNRSFLLSESQCSILSVEPRRPHWQCLSLVEFSQNRHRHQLPFHFNVRGGKHLSETKHHFTDASGWEKPFFQQLLVLIQNLWHRMQAGETDGTADASEGHG